MAYTKIHAIRATVDKAIEYICNPDKTDDSILIYSFGCSPETANFDFAFALSKTRQPDSNKAYHLIQSFLPGEVGFDEAHDIGKQLADSVLEDRYSYVISTHIDRGHIHNHIIFCAADNIEHKKYNDCKKTYYRIRKLSDDLCKEHNLSVIQPNQPKRGKKDWNRTQIRKDIDDAINNCTDYGHFIKIMLAKGYEVKGYDLSATNQKYISFLKPGMERFIRGSEKSLGAEYTKERIAERISERIKTRKSGTQNKDKINSALIDVSQERFQDKPYLKRWAEKQNLMTAASMYSSISSIPKLEEDIAAQKTIAATSKSALKTLELEIKRTAEILTYAKQYKANKIYNSHYKKAKDRDAYFRGHETQLILYNGAKNILQQKGIDVKTLDISQLTENYSRLLSKKKELQENYGQSLEDLKEMEKKLETLNDYIGRKPNIDKMHVTVQTTTILLLVNMLNLKKLLIHTKTSENKELWISFLLSLHLFLSFF